MEDPPTSASTVVRLWHTNIGAAGISSPHCDSLSSVR
jgi:hypothetical protein